jgi:alcohol dehydrogenase class IV
VESFVHHIPTRVVAGPGSLDRLGGEVVRYPRKCLVVCGRRSARLSGLLERVVGQLEQSRIESVVFDEVEPNPTVDTISDGAARARESRARWILGVGGGSALDAAKAIALMAVNQGDVRAFFSGLRPENEPFPVVAIPTTAGTGSEVTPYTVITDMKESDKFAFGLPSLFPQLAILDPDLTVSLPEAVTIDTGLDALSHAIESCFSRRRSPCTDLLAREAVERIYANLPLVREQPEHVEARAQMQLAATLAGWAIANTATLAPHAMGFPITVHYNLPHGRATVLLLPAFLAKLAEIDPVRVGQVGAWLGNRDDAPGALRTFIESLGVAPCLGAYGMREDDIGPFTRTAAQKKNIANCPGTWPEDVLQEIYRNSL